MTNALKETYAFFFKNDRKIIVERIRARDVPPLVQFALYACCGALASVVYAGTVMILSHTVIPAYEGMKVNGVLISDNLRAYNYTINSCIAFTVANAFAYVSNILLVFKSGRHHPVLEFLFFTLVSGAAFLLSLAIGPILIKYFHAPTNAALLSNMVTAALMNFAGRKFFVFKG